MYKNSIVFGFGKHLLLLPKRIGRIDDFLLSNPRLDAESSSLPARFATPTIKCVLITSSYEPSINDVITSKEEGFGNKIGTKIRNTIPALVRFVIKLNSPSFLI